MQVQRCISSRIQASYPSIPICEECTTAKANSAAQHTHGLFIGAVGHSEIFAIHEHFPVKGQLVPALSVHCKIPVK